MVNVYGIAGAYSQIYELSSAARARTMLSIAPKVVPRVIFIFGVIVTSNAS